MRQLALLTVSLLLCACDVPVPSLCDAESCQGCCGPDGTCVAGDEHEACGRNANACAVCGAAEVCGDGACVQAGTGGGSATGGGGQDDGGAGDDAGLPDDGGTGDDAGANDDAGMTEDAGSATDAGPGLTPQWLLDTGLSALELGVLINDLDPISVQVGERYIAARSIPAKNVVHLAIDGGTATTLSAAAFAPLKDTADAVALDAGLQAWAITWTRPYRVGCMSIGTAFAVGFDAGFCSTPCGVTTSLRTYDDEGAADAGRSPHRPFDSFGVRPTMMLPTGADAGATFDLIARGVAADGTNPRGSGWFFRTTDAARSVRWSDFLLGTLPQWTPDGGLDLVYVDQLDGGAQALTNEHDVLFYFQSLANVPGLATNTYRPGAVADHLTSYGGQVPTSGQMSVLRWLEAGATASYGTVVEPCNFTTKFPNTTVLLSHYYRGEPIIEAYWKSVSMPGEGLFVGEPLATPWKPSSTWDAATRTLTLTTTQLKPGLRYRIESAPSPTGPWATVQAGLSAPRFGPTTLSVQPATEAWYRLVRD